MKTPAIVHSRFSRLAVAVLVAISRGSPLLLWALLMFVDTRLSNQLRLMRTFAALCLAPGIAAWLLERAFAATVSIDGGQLVLQRRGQRVEIPCDAIDRILPWLIPLPAGGVWLRMRSGRRLPYGLQVADPVALIDALAGAGARPEVRIAAGHSAAVYARSTYSPSRRWYHPVLKFPVFGLVPTLPLFRLHQWIAYGGTFGEYYSYGLQAYLLAFAIYWITFTIYLVLYAALLRAVAETVVFVTAWLTPARIAGVRRATDIAVRILYFGAVPAVLVRYLLS